MVDPIIRPIGPPCDITAERAEEVLKIADVTPRPFSETLFGHNKVTLYVGGNIDITDTRTGESVTLGNAVAHDTSIDTLIEHLKGLLNVVRGI